MNERVEHELEMVRACYPELEFRESGLWVRIPSYPIPTHIWIGDEVEVAFQIPEQLPGQPPYGFYVHPDLRLRPDGDVPQNYTCPAETPWGGDWGKFSWQLNPWVPASDPAAGSNMLNFVRSFADRFRQGS